MKGASAHGTNSQGWYRRRRVSRTRGGHCQNLEEERQHTCEVVRAFDQMEEAKSVGSSSNVEKVRSASSQVRMVQQEGKSRNRQEVSQEDGMVQ